MKKICLALVLCSVSIGALADGNPKMCEYYASTEPSDYGQQVKELMLGHATNSAQIKAITHASNDTLNRAAYALWCDSDFDSNYIIDYTFGIAPTKAWRHNR